MRRSRGAKDSVRGRTTLGGTGKGSAIDSGVPLFTPLVGPDGCSHSFGLLGGETRSPRGYIYFPSCGNGKDTLLFSAETRVSNERADIMASRLTPAGEPILLIRFIPDYL